MDELARLNMALKATFLKMGIYKKADMAEYLGYKSPYFSGVINGKERLSDQFLKNISDKVGISKDYILKGEGDMTGNEQVSEDNTGVGISDNNVNGASINNHEAFLEITELLRKIEEMLERKDAQIERLLGIIERGQKR